MMEEFAYKILDDILFDDVDKNQKTNDPFLSQAIADPPSVNNGLTNSGGAEQSIDVKTEPYHVDTPITISAGTLGIDLQATDSTKAVVPENGTSYRSYRVRKDAKLSVDLTGLAAPVWSPNLKYKFWIGYQNRAIELPVENRDPLKRKEDGNNSPASLAVFALSSNSKDTHVNWYRESNDGPIVAEVINWNKDLFIEFLAVSSELKKGNGWRLNVQVDIADNQAILAQVDVKCLKIIRDVGVKRTFSASNATHALLPPSPITSEEGSDKDEDIRIPDIRSMSVEELIAKRNQINKIFDAEVLRRLETKRPRMD